MSSTATLIPAGVGAGSPIAPRQERAALAVAMLGFAVVTLDAQIGNVALPSIHDALGGGLCVATPPCLLLTGLTGGKRYPREAAELTPQRPRRPCGRLGNRARVSASVEIAGAGFEPATSGL